MYIRLGLVSKESLLDDDAEWVTLLGHSLDNHPCERKVSETSFTLVKSLKFIPLGRRRLQFFALTNFITETLFSAASKQKYKILIFV